MLQSTATDQKKPSTLAHRRHRDDNWVDGSTIDTVPRWKSSGLSGDEWRFSHRVRLYRKGFLLAEKSFGRAEHAALWLSLQLMQACPAEHPWPSDAPGGPHGDGVMCDQPGCANLAAWQGKLHDVFSPQGEGPLPESYFTFFRVFCADHKSRGDCSREDADINYYDWQEIGR